MDIAKDVLPMSVVDESVIILTNSSDSPVEVVGSRAYSKVALHTLNLPTPSAFVITSVAFHQFLSFNNGLSRWRSMLDNCRPLSPDDIASTAQSLQKLVLNQEFEPQLAIRISDVYNHCLKSHWAHLTISPTPATKAPVNYPLPVIKGDAVLLDFLRKIWAAQLSPHALSLYLNSHPPTFIDPAPVIVSQFEPATTSGSIFTLDPITTDKNLIRISAIWGTNPQTDPRPIPPDEYVLQKNTGMVMSRHLEPQNSFITIDRFGHYRTLALTSSQKIQPKLTDPELNLMLKAAVKIQDYCMSPQQINWLAVNDKIYFTRFARYDLHPSHPHLIVSNHPATHTRIIARGLAASPGIATAPLIHPASTHASYFDRIVIFQDATVALIQKARHAAGIIIESGGLSTELVVAAREIGLPVLVGTGPIKLPDNQVVTLDALKGQLIQSLNLPDNKPLTPPSPPHNPTLSVSHPSFATKIYVNTGLPVEKPAKPLSEADGVGICRGTEIMLAFDAHPKYMVQHHPQEFKKLLVDTLTSTSLQYGNRPVYYYPYDRDTASAAQLPHGKEYETTQEHNPLLGYRGARRMGTDDVVFNAEIDCIADVRNKHNCKNLSLIIPLVRSVEEFAVIKRKISTRGLYRSPSFTLSPELSTPIAPFLIADLVHLGIDGLFVNLDHLTALMLGYDPNNAEVDQCLDIKHPAVLKLLQEMTQAASTHHLPVTVSAYQIEQQPEALEAVIRAGATGISISSHRLESVRAWVQTAEAKITTASYQNLK